MLLLKARLGRVYDRNQQGRHNRRKVVLDKAIDLIHVRLCYLDVLGELAEQVDCVQIVDGRFLHQNWCDVVRE